ncbi:MAG: hypothetical protein J1F40_09220 [Prevotellaceae bacterium]|nr:hypothetical protein [Prevotellaceae bacterium]
MKKNIILLLLMFIVSLYSSAIEDIKVGTTTRTIIAYAPEGLPKQPALVIVCHGANQDAAYIQSLSQWETVADTAKFVVVYANGVNKFWDISGTSDLKFMETIIDSMYSRHHINRNRVYLTGFSMGGMFTYHAANKMADKIAAFAPVSGYPMGGPNATSSRPVPILHTHGTADDVCTYGPVQSHIDAWVKFNGCDATPEVIKPYPKSKPNSPASLKRYRNGKNGVEVALLTLADKGHWWSMDAAQAITSEEVWNFCKRYSLGGEEPEVKSIVPEDKSFDLLPERDNRFTVTFSDSIDCSRVSATLTSDKGGAEIPLTVEDNETGQEVYKPTVTFAIPQGTTLADGEYTLTIANAINQDEGTMPRKKFTYAYGIEEVGATPSIDIVYMPDWYAERPLIGEGIPTGWRRINTAADGTKEVTKGGTADCVGVRMKYFQPEGDFDAGIYLSARDNASCNLHYGVYTDHLLPLKTGKYRISFNSIYWSEGALNANATYNFNLLTSTNTVVFSAPSLTSTGTLKENSEQPIIGSKAYEFSVTITKDTNYLLNFEMNEGWNSVIIGNIAVTTQPTLADRYKGTFYRTMLAAQKALRGYEDTTEGAALKSVIDKYADFSSTSPTAYTAANDELSQALDAFNAADKDPALGITPTQDTSATSSPTDIYSLSGVKMTSTMKGLNIIRTSNGEVKKVLVK